VNEGPTLARLIGFIGLFLLILGIVVVAATRAVGPRWVPEGWGFMAGALGLALMLYHAATDGEQEIRRIYGGAALFLLLVALVVSIIPGPFGTTVVNKQAGYYLLPWGVGAGLLGLLFTISFCRHETEEFYRNGASNILLAVGGLLTVGSVATGVFKSDFLAGPGIALALLGVGFLCAYLARTDTSEGIGYTVAFTLGAVGAAIIIYSIGRSIFPTLLYDGPAVLRRPNGTLDRWRVFSRLLEAIAFLVPALIAFLSRSPVWLRGVLGVVGVLGVGVILTSFVSNPVHDRPVGFLIPDGLILIGLGLIYLTFAVGICSDNQFVILTRRELSSYFLSPIGYLVLAGMLLMQWLSYWLFISLLERVSSGPSPQPIPEPILEHYFFAIIPVFVLLLVVPALTMRLFAEEKRSGSLEVLFTAPVNEWPVVLSKFIGTWIFYLLTWLPAGLFLIALRIETGVPFDYRPLLSFYVCLAAQGLAFVGMGLFFSALTKNQIVAAVLTFAGMMLFLVCFLFREAVSSFGLPTFVQTAMSRLAFPSMWGEALSGRLPIRDVLLYSSLGFFWLFLSVKVLETRKWN
jgi:ABC-type transport system involved in multi-copper enzyme maturation permease subunit